MMNDGRTPHAHNNTQQEKNLFAVVGVYIFEFKLAALKTHHAHFEGATYILFGGIAFEKFEEYARFSRAAGCGSECRYRPTTHHG